LHVSAVASSSTLKRAAPSIHTRSTSTPGFNREIGEAVEPVLVTALDEQAFDRAK